MLQNPGQRRRGERTVASGAAGYDVHGWGRDAAEQRMAGTLVSRVPMGEATQDDEDGEAVQRKAMAATSSDNEKNGWCAGGVVMAWMRRFRRVT
jgi:hypothetical protein